MRIIYLMYFAEDLELFRQKLALEQEQRIHNHEMKLQLMQKERQAVFEDAFQYDLLEYKRTGQVPSKYWKKQ